jgi:hypothetical protein
MPELVYILCGLTSLGCAAMLFRGYTRSRSPLLFWSCACFVCFTVTNVLLFIDLVMIPGVDLSFMRNLINLVGVTMLIYGMIFDVV